MFLLAYGNGIYPNKLDPERFADHAIWLMDRYKGKVKYWEVWNEPANFQFLKTYGGTWNGKEKDGSESPWVGKFAEFVTIVAARLKAAHPEMKLVAGTSSVVDVRLLRDHPKMWENIDVFSIHPYPFKLPPELQAFGGDKILERDGVALAGPDHSFSSMIAILRDLLAKAGKPNLPIWTTEVGYPTFRPRTPDRLWGGMTEKTQAAYLCRFAVLSAALGVDRTLFYCYMDGGDNDGDREQRFGIVHRDGSPKPAYTALQRLASLMPGDTRRSDLTVGVTRLAPVPRTDAVVWDAQTIQMLDEPQVHALKRPDGKTVVFFWRAGRVYADLQDELCRLEIRGSAKPLALKEAGYLVSGEKLQLKSESGPWGLRLEEVPMGADPVYLIVE
jgi:hypothetical protein